ncbi:MAG: starch-binding protein [Ruminococcaceae bacterium]|nr:starch-binding protein [Oscillospiraceae bacterium]
MKRAKGLLSVILAIMTLVSVFAIGFTTQAAETQVAETAVAYPKAANDFTWDNATVYFLLTDRFNNGNTSNDNSYNRGLDKNGNKVDYGTIRNGSSTFNGNVATFQGGDFKGITKKLNEGYFTDLGVNAIWVAGWFEQIHGYTVGGDGKQSFAHYAYHGYYGADFSELDKNFGTEAEFKEMIDTAHSKGIRIVLDVVLNHPGYNTIYDMNEYNFGTLKNGWQDKYFNFSKISQDNYHSVIDYDSDPNAWLRWWGADWIRAGLAGYKADGTNDLTNSQVYLPDFKTESTKTFSDVPTYLKTKWTKEGTYSQKMNELNATFQKYNLSGRTVRNHLVAWYAQWVEQFGIDGFRCDTAKHVEQESWKALSTACTKALENWRKANPNAPGANWDEEFWMTGENYGQGVDYNQYYQNGFDSMINFSLTGSSTGSGCDGMKKVGNLNETYASYAGKINTNDNFNVLTYISSHDTGLCRNDIYYQGSAFLLLPGGVQIFYGDESNRQLVDCSIPDHKPRGFMNWSELSNSSSEASKVLDHWQKVGTFRNNHVAVGAGAHTNLNATNGVAFARTYNKGGVTDNVACVVGANNNTNITITLGNTFANGATVRNAYDGKTATVENGKVIFNSGAHGTILVELAAGAEIPTTKPTQPIPSTPTTETKPTTIPTSNGNINIPAEYVVLGDADLSGKVNVKDATAVQKFVAGLESFDDKAKFAANVDGSETVNVKDATAIQKCVADIETGFAIGENVLYKGSEDTPVNPTTKPTTKPADNPVIPTLPTTDTTPIQPDGTVDLTQLDTNVIVLINSSYSNPYTHTWTDGGDAYDAWPGTQMQSVGGGYYFAMVDKSANRIIFNDNGGAQTDDLVIPDNFAIFDMAKNDWAGLLSDVVDVTKFPLDPSLLPNNPDPGPGTDDPNPPVPDGDYIYFKNTLDWGNLHCHVWTDGGGSAAEWPGLQMESMGNGIYRCQISDQYNRVVFNNGGNGQQTGDLTIEWDKAYNQQTNMWEDM